MEDTKITFETAKLAKEKGFPQEPNKLKIPYYNYKGEFKGDVSDWLRKYLKKEDTSDVESVSAPTQSLLAKWLREKHGVDISILILGISDYQVYVHKKRELKYNGIVNFVFDNKDNIYEEALEIGLQEALKLINYD